MTDKNYQIIVFPWKNDSIFDIQLMHLNSISIFIFMNKKKLATDKKVVTFGEVMLRLTTPAFAVSPNPMSLLQPMVAARPMLPCRWPTSVSLRNLSPVCPTMPLRMLVLLPSVLAVWTRGGLSLAVSAWDYIIWRVVPLSEIPMWCMTVKIPPLPRFGPA